MNKLYEGVWAYHEATIRFNDETPGCNKLIEFFKKIDRKVHMMKSPTHPHRAMYAVKLDMNDYERFVRWGNRAIKHNKKTKTLLQV